MNLQNLMKQAQSMQKKMENEKSKIDSEIFEGRSELVNIKMNGKRELISVNIKKDINFSEEDIEILEDMIKISINDAERQINSKLNSMMGSQLGGFSGMF